MKYKKKKSSRRYILIIILIIISLSAFLVASKRNIQLISKIQDDPVEKNELERLWAERDFNKIYNLTNAKLEENPLDKEALFLYGASLYYLGNSRISTEERMELLDQAIFSLRKLRSISGKLYNEQIDYLLGKAYLGKGQFYADLSILHIEASIEAGYVNKDSYEYLAEAYSLVGKYEESLYYLEKVLESSPNDRVFLKIAENSFQNADYNRAEQFYIKALESSQDELLVKDVLFQLGTLYYNLKNFVQAEKVLSQYLEIDYNNRDAHFMLGESYFYMGDLSSARKEWRRAERIDPYYRPVLVRLYN